MQIDKAIPHTKNINTHQGKYWQVGNNLDIYKSIYLSDTAPQENITK